MKLRIIFSFILLLIGLFSPFWITFPLAILGIIYFKLFWEGAVIVLTLDLFFGIREVRFSDITYISFISFIIIMIIAEIIKKKMNLKEYN